MKLGSEKSHISHSKCYFANLDKQNMQRWVASLQFEFEGNPTVNKSEIVVLPK